MQSSSHITTINVPTLKKLRFYRSDAFPVAEPSVSKRLDRYFSQLFSCRRC